MSSESKSNEEIDARRDAHDELIIAALITGASYEQAATAAGVSARTVRRRMADEDFASEVRSRRAERATRLSAALLDIGHQAIEVLSEALADENAGIRLKASQAVLTLGQRYRREVEVMDRIDALERRFNARDEVGHAQS